MDHAHHHKGISVWGWIIGPGDGSPVKGRGRDAIGAIGTALLIIGRYALILAGVFLALGIGFFLDMLLLLLMLMDGLLAGSHPSRFDQKGKARKERQGSCKAKATYEPVLSYGGPKRKDCSGARLKRRGSKNLS